MVGNDRPFAPNEIESTRGKATQFVEVIETISGREFF